MYYYLIEARHAAGATVLTMTRSTYTEAIEKAMELTKYWASVTITRCFAN